MSNGLDEEKRQALLKLTHDAALAAAADIQYLRKMIARAEPDPDEIRRSSSVLRRLLIDNAGDLRKIAPPRIRRLEIVSPDITPLVRANAKNPFIFMSTGNVSIFGMEISTVAYNDSNKPSIKDFSPDSEVYLSMDGFLRQETVCYKGDWVSRAQIIKYVANVAHGVHTGDPHDNIELLLRRIRHSVATGAENGEFKLHINADILHSVDRPAILKKGAIDFVLLQLITAAGCIVRSPKIQELERIIAAEDG